MRDTNLKIQNMKAKQLIEAFPLFIKGVEGNNYLNISEFFYDTI